MKPLLALAAVLAVGFAAWSLTHREPPDISESEAKKQADGALVKFCLEEQFTCPDFAFKGRGSPTDRRFSWSFRYENPRPDPGQRIVVSVGKKGEFTLEIGRLPPDSKEFGPEGSRVP